MIWSFTDEPTTTPAPESMAATCFNSFFTIFYYLLRIRLTILQILLKYVRIYQKNVHEWRSFVARITTWISAVKKPAAFVVSKENYNAISNCKGG